MAAVEKLSGKISDRIRGELAGKVEINPERGQEKQTKTPPDHSGESMGGTGRNK